MKWYYRKEGIHVKVRVFTNGGKNGDLTFRDDEFTALQNWFGESNLIIFEEEK